MPYILIEEFKRGLDSRRPAIAAAAGTLTELSNAHITRGGDIEKRKAFVSKYSLPAGTFGLASAGGALFVFGSADTPDLPTGVNYQRLQHPSGSAMSKMLMAEVFNGKLYVVAQFADATIHHFYDGTRVSDWFDGRARGSFDVTGGSAGAGTSATGSFQITGGTASAGVNRVTAVTVNGVDVLGAPVDWVTSNAATATAVAAQINSHTSSPNYSASAIGDVVVIAAPAVGVAFNGLVVAASNDGDVTTGAVANMSGGVDANAITSVKVNGVEILNGAVLWATSNSNTASLVATQINSYASTPEYTAVADGSKVTILAAAAAEATPNGFAVAVTSTGTAATGNVVDMANGQAGAGTFTPGSSARTVKTKMYSTSGSLLHFSKVNDPTKWQSSEVGAGFTNISNHASGSEVLTALEVYYTSLVIFARSAIQIWNVDADDTKNQQIQVLKNTGTAAPRSVLAFGDGDVFYLAKNGIRALRARDSSNVAMVSEVGTAIDTIVTELLRTLPDATREAAVAAVEPVDGRLWIAIGTRVFVFSYFTGSDIAAWSEYLPGFTITDLVVINDKIYARAGDTVYLYGGDDGVTYDSSEVIVGCPFFDAQAPATLKGLTAIDVAVEGEWTVHLAMDPSQPSARSEVGIVTGQTFSLQKVAATGGSTHFAPRLRHADAGYARISSIAIHYETADAQ